MRKLSSILTCTSRAWGCGSLWEVHYVLGLSSSYVQLHLWNQIIEKSGADVSMSCNFATLLSVVPLESVFSQELLRTACFVARGYTQGEDMRSITETLLGLYFDFVTVGSVSSRTFWAGLYKLCGTFVVAYEHICAEWTHYLLLLFYFDIF